MKQGFKIVHIIQSVKTKNLDFLYVFSLETCRLTAKIAKIKEFGTARLVGIQFLDLRDHGRMKREYSLDTNTG